VREALRLRLELKRDPLAPLPAPEPPPGARWPEEFFYTWLLLVPPLEEVEEVFLYPLGGKSALLDWTMVFALRPLRLEVQEPWRQEPLPREGGLQDWVRRVPLSVRTLWLADLEVEMGLELPDLLDPVALRDFIEEELEPEARTLLVRLAREERLPLSQVEEEVLRELERRFLAFAGAGEVGVPQDLRATLSRLF
jgi:hypothetical protein